MPRLLPAVALLLALAAPGARADETLGTLLGEWQLVRRRMDARGLGEQREVLDRIAALRTEAAREALGTLLGQARARGQVRLVLAALVRHADPAWIDRVIQWAEADPSGAVQEALGEALGEVRDPASRAHLAGPALRRAVPAVKVRIAEGLGRLGGREAVPALLLLLRHANLDVRTAALEAVGRVGEPMAAGPVALFLRDPDWRIRDAAARALGLLGGERVVPALVAVLADEHPRVAESAATALGRLDARRAVPALVDRLERDRVDDRRVAHACAEALQAVTGQRFGADPEVWRAWWETAKDRAPEPRPEPLPPGARTVPAQRYYGFGIHSSKLVFVLDVSRSMGWNDRLASAKRELVRALESLPKRTRFNIVTFSDGADAWKAGLQPATPGLVRKAVAFVQRQHPDNGTNTWAAIEAALADEDVDTVFFLSDGNPSVGTTVDPEAILAQLRRSNRYRRVRFHCVALVRGEPPAGFAAREDRTRSERFMRHLAGQTDGGFQLVE